MASHGSNERAKFAIRTVSPSSIWKGPSYPRPGVRSLPISSRKSISGRPESPRIRSERGKPTFRDPSARSHRQEGAGESDARQVFHRLAFTWTEWGKKAGYFDTEEDSSAFYDEILHMLARQMAAPNSPQWFNTGLHAVYGIEGPAQGHYYVDPATGDVTKSASAYERPQPHACFILNIEDDLVNEGGIMDLSDARGAAFQVWLGHGLQLLQNSRSPRVPFGRGRLQRSVVLPQDRRPLGERDQIRRNDPPRREDGDPRRRPSRYRVLYELEGRGGVQGRLSRRRFGPDPRAGGCPRRGRSLVRSQGRRRGRSLRRGAFFLQAQPRPSERGEIGPSRGHSRPLPPSAPLHVPPGRLLVGRGSQEVRYGLGGRCLQLRLRPVLEQFGAIEQRLHARGAGGRATGSSRPERPAR